MGRLDRQQLQVTPFVALPIVGWSLAASLLLSLPLVRRWGRSEERECALTLAFAVALELGIEVLVPLAPISLSHFAGNLLALILVARNALRSARLYPLVMAAAQLIAVIAHGLFWTGLIDPKLSYPIILTAMSSATLAALWTGCASQRLWPNPQA